MFRCFGEVAELPLLAVRPELQQRNGLGRLLLAAMEQLLLVAGAKVGSVQCCFGQWVACATGGTALALLSCCLPPQTNPGSVMQHHA